MTNCPNCGAPITGHKCQYCGAIIFDFASEQFDGIYPQTGMCVEGSALTSAKKTGRHFDVDKVLKEMKSD